MSGFPQHFGWREPISTLESLRIAVGYISSGGRYNFRVRMDKATYPLALLRPEDFPIHLRGIAGRVLSVRGRVARKYVTDTLFHFELLTSGRMRKAFTDDIFKLYEACLLDLGRMEDYRDIVYPKDK